MVSEMDLVGYTTQTRMHTLKRTLLNTHLGITGFWIKVLKPKTEALKQRVLAKGARDIFFLLKQEMNAC